MSRTFAPISKKDLEQKVFHALSVGTGIEPHLIRKKLGKDLKVKFDFENFDAPPGTHGFSPKGLMGFQTLKNGLTFCGMSAGGDWEYPVFFIVYWDGKRLRGYVPTEGNPWNATTKEAYGNDEVADLKDAKKRYSEFEDAEDIDSCDFEADDKLIKEDILARIQPGEGAKPKKTLQSRIEAATFHGCGDEAYELFQEACHFCYSLSGLGYDKEAESVCRWAEDMAKLSQFWWKENMGDEKPDTAQGCWG